MKKGRLTIGVFVSGITDDFTILMCRGILQMAKKFDVDTVVFPGKYLNRDVSSNPDLTYEYQNHTVFSYANKKNVDALIVAAGAIGCLTNKESVENLLNQFSDIPCILVAYKLGNYADVSFDNCNGIKEGLNYLIEKTGCRKIGMLGGTEDNTDALERKRTFIDVLGSHGIEFSDQIYVEGDFTRHYKEAFKELLDKNPDLEAVFCVNDDTAVGLYEEAEKRGRQVGKDFHILGYDDIPVAAKLNPPLSTVRADAAELGEEALKMAIRLVHGEKVKNEVLPTKFVKRDSIGTKTQTEDGFPIELFSSASIDGYFDDIFFRYRHEKYEDKMRNIQKAFRELISTLALIYGKGEDTQENAIKIEKALDGLLNEEALQYADISNLLNCFEGIYRALKNALPDGEKKFRLQGEFSVIYRKIIRATDVRFAKIAEQQSKENYSMKMFVRDVLQFEKGNDQSYTSMLGNLEWLGIKNAYVYTFKNPVMHLSREQFLPPKQMYLKAALQEGRVRAVPSLRQAVQSQNIFNNSYMDKEKRSDYVCLPLFSREVLYGMLLCDLTEGIFINGEFLVNQMSSAAKMITLLKTNEEIQQELEDSLTVLRENNLVLYTLSKYDSLTGVLNRRGFYIEAEKVIEETKKEGMNLLAIYVDMNNLKIINDRYGHEEGDFSIKLIGNILSEEMKEVGVAGRIGGDEFACIMKYQNDDEGEDILNKIYQRFTTFNDSSNKPYNITVSAGACLMSGEDETALQEALTQADEKLYEVKKFRKKDVAK